MYVCVCVSERGREREKGRIRSKRSTLNFARPSFSARKRERNEETLDANGERSNAGGKISSGKILVAGYFCIETSNRGIRRFLFAYRSSSPFVFFSFSPPVGNCRRKIDTERCESSRETRKGERFEAAHLFSKFPASIVSRAPLSPSMAHR